MCGRMESDLTRVFYNVEMHHEGLVNKTFNSLLRGRAWPTSQSKVHGRKSWVVTFCSELWLSCLQGNTYMFQMNKLEDVAECMHANSISSQSLGPIATNLIPLSFITRNRHFFPYQSQTLHSFCENLSSILLRKGMFHLLLKRGNMHFPHH